MAQLSRTELRKSLSLIGKILTQTPSMGLSPKAKVKLNETKQGMQKVIKNFNDFISTKPVKKFSKKTIKNLLIETMKTFGKPVTLQEISLSPMLKPLDITQLRNGIRQMILAGLLTVIFNKKGCRFYVLNESPVKTLTEFQQEQIRQYRLSQNASAILNLLKSSLIPLTTNEIQKELKLLGTIQSSLTTLIKHSLITMTYEKDQGYKYSVIASQPQPVIPNTLKPVEVAPIEPAKKATKEIKPTLKPVMIDLLKILQSSGIPMTVNEINAIINVSKTGICTNARDLDKKYHLVNYNVVPRDDLTKSKYAIISIKPEKTEEVKKLIEENSAIN